MGKDIWKKNLKEIEQYEVKKNKKKKTKKKNKEKNQRKKRWVLRNKKG